MPAGVSGQLPLPLLGSGLEIQQLPPPGHVGKYQHNDAARQRTPKETSHLAGAGGAAVLGCCEGRRKGGRRQAWAERGRGGGWAAEQCMATRHGWLCAGHPGGKAMDWGWAWFGGGKCGGGAAGEPAGQRRTCSAAVLLSSMARLHGQCRGEQAQAAAGEHGQPGRRESAVGEALGSHSHARMPGGL